MSTDPALERYALHLSRAYRLAQLGLRVDGQAFDLAKYPHCVQIIDDDHRDIVVIKGAQLGLTIAHVLKALDRAIRETLRGTLYLFPRDDDVSDFSKARFRRILQDNAELGRYVGETESIGIKEVGDSFIYFRAAGAKDAATQGSKSKLKSIPIDDLYYDERDDMPDDRVTLADERLSASEDPHRTELGTPEIPEFGVDARFQSSDQNLWHHKCRRCRAWTCFESTWPDCLGIEADRAFYLCSKCREPLDDREGPSTPRPAIEQSQWVAAHPEREAVRGYWISQLNSPQQTPLAIATAWDVAELRGGDKLAEFYRSKLGMPYADEDAVLTEAAVLGACGNNPRTAGSEGPTALGADVGPNLIHFEIREKISDDGRRSRVIQWGVVKSFHDLGDLVRRYGVRCAVIDEMAETRSVRAFCKDHAGKAFGCWYSPAQKGRTRWDIPGQMVFVNRTESLDDSHHEIVACECELPRRDELLTQTVLPQLVNLARVVKQDETTGARTAKWIVRGAKNDHLRHAHNYAKIALERIGLVERLRRIRENAPRSGHKKKRGFMGR